MSEDKGATASSGTEGIKTETDDTEAQGEKAQGEEAEGEKVEAEGDKAEAEGEKMEAEGEKVEAKVEKVEAEGEKMETDQAFLDKISLAMPGDEAVPDKADQEEDEGRKILMRNINKKKSGDEIEDYLFDNYPEAGIEEIEVCTRENRRAGAGKLEKWFTGTVIVKFGTEKQAAAFLAGKLVKEEQIGFRGKLSVIGLAESRKRKKEMKEQNAELKKQQRAASVPRQVAGKVVECEGFRQTPLAEIKDYMQNNHESVDNVVHRRGKIIVTFGGPKPAERFLGLTYVKFKGGYITRTAGKVEVEQEMRAQSVPAGQPGAAVGQLKRKASEVNLEQTMFKLSGMAAGGTNYKLFIKELVRCGLTETDIEFVNTEQADAIVRLKGSVAGGLSAVMDRLSKATMMVEGTRLRAARLNQAELVQAKRRKSMQRKQSKPKIDWSNY